jgi:hypothetical protein
MDADTGADADVGHPEAAAEPIAQDDHIRKKTRSPKSLMHNPDAQHKAPGSDNQTLAKAAGMSAIAETSAARRSLGYGVSGQSVVGAAMAATVSAGTDFGGMEFFGQCDGASDTAEDAEADEEHYIPPVYSSRSAAGSIPTMPGPPWQLAGWQGRLLADRLLADKHESNKSYFVKEESLYDADEDKI